MFGYPTKLWLDDMRLPPDGWFWASSYKDAIKAIKEKDIMEINFDHDLSEKRTGADVARYIEKLAKSGKLSRIRWQIHSMNPVGAENIRRTMESCERIWNKQGSRYKTTCPECLGTGQDDPPPGKYHGLCTKCNGKGWVYES
jgi:hypothetical protein